MERAEDESPWRCSALHEVGHRTGVIGITAEITGCKEMEREPRPFSGLP